MSKPPSTENPASVFDETYFMRGPSTGVSNYENYTWRPELTIPMAGVIKRYLRIRDGETVLDFGSSRGFLVRALREIGVNAYGYDISKWAIANCDPHVRPFVSNEVPAHTYSWCIAKDVFEHMSQAQLEDMIPTLLARVYNGLFIIVPLTARTGGDYVGPADNKDATHIIRWTLPDWIHFLQEFDRSMVVTGSFHIPGIKQASEPWPGSCGFITMRR